MLKSFQIYSQSLQELSVHRKLLITTINAHSYNMTKTDLLYNDSLLNSDVLIPDGISVVWALKWLKGESLKKIAGDDLFFYEMERLNQTGGKCFFFGSSEETLSKIKDRLAKDYPNIKAKSYSPPFKKEFTAAENATMIEKINNFSPQVLFIGMTAPKQEKWAYQNLSKLEVGHICCIGAVFDFYSGTVKRAPKWMIKIGLEWFYRFIKEPRRMWRRYIIGNTVFIGSVILEKFKN